MGKIRNWLRKFSFRVRHELSIENVVLILAILLGAIWTFQSIQAMSRNWELSERLATERKNLELIEIEVETAELENEYYKTDEYKELAARKYLDKKFAGENMVVMPENSEVAVNKHKTVVEEVKEKEYSNFEKWMKFLFP